MAPAGAAKAPACICVCHASHHTHTPELHLHKSAAVQPAAPCSAHLEQAAAGHVLAHDAELRRGAEAHEEDEVGVAQAGQQADLLGKALHSGAVDVQQPLDSHHGALVPPHKHLQAVQTVAR
jgi:hypothetical protein